MPRDTPYAGVAGIVRSAFERGEAPRVFEDGARLRDFVHVGDVARASVPALERDSVVTGALRRGDVRHVFGTPDRAAAVLGFRAEVSLEAGMAEFAHAPPRLPARGAG